MIRPIHVVALVALVAAAVSCSDDDSSDTGDTAGDTAIEDTASADRAPADTDGESEPASTDGSDGAADGLLVTVDGESISVEGSAAAGAVDVTTEGSVFEVDFSLVADGTTEDEFRTAITAVTQGGPIDDLLLNNTGAPPGDSTILLEEGQYFVWAELQTAADPEPMIFITGFEVGPGDEGQLPETDGTFTTVDYGFEVDVAAGDSYTVVNDGPNEFHHAIVYDFGDLDPDVVRENLPEFLTAGDQAPLPEALGELDFATINAAGSPVHGPGSAGTFPGRLQSGHTYAVVCFIQDRAGGPPHALAHDMWEVFEVT